MLYKISRKCFRANGAFRYWAEEYWKCVDLTDSMARYYERFKARYNPLEIFPECRKKRIVMTANDRITLTKEEIKQAAAYPIETLFVQYGITARRNMVNCPFHDDKNASMSIARHNRYKCFSCGEKGNTIDFIMKHEGLDFVSAVRKLLDN